MKKSKDVILYGAAKESGLYAILTDIGILYTDDEGGWWLGGGGKVGVALFELKKDASRFARHAKLTSQITCKIHWVKVVKTRIFVKRGN